MKAGQVAEAAASFVPVHQLMTFVGTTGAPDPDLNQQAGTALGVALIGGVAGKVVEWVPTKLGTVAKAGEAIAEQRQLGKAGEGVTSSAENTIVTQSASGSKPSVMFGNTVDATPGSGFVRFSDDFTEHILNRDFEVPAKRGIGGAHNLDEFMKYSNEFKIVDTVEHPTVDGIQTIRYQVAARDPAGNFTGAFRDKVFEKTVFDPSIIFPDTFLTWGRQAAAEGQALGALNRTWFGTAPNGLKFMGYLDNTGAVRSFFPEF